MGAGRIAGITIEFDGNTTKLNSSLKDIDKSLKQTDRSLRDVNRLLKFDPTNTELLKQKQQLLAQKIVDTKDRLKQLKEADKQAKAQLDAGTLGKEKYDALQREIVDTEGQLKALEKQARETSSVLGTKMQEAGEKMQKVGDNIQDVGKKLMPVSAGTAAAGVAVGKMAIDFEDSMANINTLLDDTSNLEGYKNAVKDMSRETGLSLDTMSAGMYQTISSIGDGGKETEEIFGTMAKAAKAGQAEVSDSVSLISAGMKGYGQVNDETAQKISDLAFQTAKLGVTTFPEMATSMQPLFPLASSLNVSYEELFGTMATLTGVTGNTSEVSTQLKAVFTGLMKPTKAMSGLLEEYGYANGQAMIEAEGFDGVLRILQEATGGQSDKLAELFGSTEALTAMTALTGDQFDVFGEKLGAMQDSAGATSAAYEKMQTTGDKMRTTWNDLEITFMELGTSLMEVLGPAIEIISEKVQQFSEWFNNLSEGQKDLIVKIGLVFAVLGPLIMIIGNVTSAIGGVISLGGTLATFFSTVGVGAGAAAAGVGGLSLSFLPIAAIVAGVIAVGVLLYKNWDTIKEKAGKLKEKISESRNNLKTKTSETWNNMKEKVSEKWNGIKDKTSEIVGNVKDKVGEGWSNIKSKTSETWSNMKSKVQENGGGIKGIITTCVDSYKSKWQTGFNAIDSITGGKLGSALTTAQNKLDSIKNAFRDKMDAAKEHVRNAIDKVKGFFNFSWSLPKLKMPHFSITGEFSLKNRTVPHLSVEWYEKAMNQAHMLKGAQIFGAMNGQLLGGGEKGEEIVMGKNYMLNLIR